MKALYQMATGEDADVVAARTLEERSRMFATFQAQIAATPEIPATEDSSAGDQVEVHPDDAAVDALAAKMKAKLAKQRAKGYGGWDTPECSQQCLSAMLRDHVAKGDPVDVANFCAFLAARGEGIEAGVQAEPVASRAASEIATAVCQRVAELDDRSSPADWPEAMLVTAEELQTILIEELAATSPAASELQRETVTKLLELARIVDRAVEDWGETLADGTSNVIFHKEEADALDAILDFLDNLPENPDPMILESGPMKAARLLSAPQAQPAFQQRVQPWMMECFGAEIAADRIERNHRFLEEALELVQATGCTKYEAFKLVNYVFKRPVGKPAQEVGGVMVTLAAHCLANGLDMQACAETELARIWTKVPEIRAKQAAKPKHSPLPMAQGADPLDEISEALHDYHYALDTRQHGGVAADAAISAIERALGMPWKQGEVSARRSAIPAISQQEQDE
jgi:hypothetical protein